MGGDGRDLRWTMKKHYRVQIAQSGKQDIKVIKRISCGSLNIGNWLSKQVVTVLRIMQDGMN